MNLSLFQNIMKFWFDKGISGFRVDAVKYFMEDVKLRNEPLLNASIRKDEYTYHDFNHIYTSDLRENIDLIHELRLFVDEINEKKGGEER